MIVFAWALIAACHDATNSSKATQLFTSEDNINELPESGYIAATPAVMFKGSAVRATGNEPSWMLELKNDSASFMMLAGPSFDIPLSQPLTNNTDSLRYLLHSDEYTLEVLFTNEPCIDDMSGYRKRFTTTVLLRHEEEENIYRGCADYLSEYQNKILEVD